MSRSILAGRAGQSSRTVTAWVLRSMRRALCTRSYSAPGPSTRRSRCRPALPAPRARWAAALEARGRQQSCVAGPVRAAAPPLLRPSFPSRPPSPRSVAPSLRRSVAPSLPPHAPSLSSLPSLPALAGPVWPLPAPPAPPRRGRWRRSTCCPALVIMRPGVTSPFRRWSLARWSGQQTLPPFQSRHLPPFSSFPAPPFFAPPPRLRR